MRMVYYICRIINTIITIISRPLYLLEVHIFREGKLQHSVKSIGDE